MFLNRIIDVLFHNSTVIILVMSKTKMDFLKALCMIYNYILFSSNLFNVFARINVRMVSRLVIFVLKVKIEKVEAGAAESIAKGVVR